MDAILFWDRFKGRWLRSTQFYYPERPADLPSLKTASELAEIHPFVVARVLPIGLS